MMKSAILNTKPLGFPWETQDPFLFCVHHEDFYPKGNEQMGPAVSLAGRALGNDFQIKDGFRMYHGRKVPGFPAHPHRGFETITVAERGLIDHSDSMGAAGRFGNGDVQWMTAGKGVQHSEMFPLLNQDADNPMELFQIWLNLPAKSKMVAPHFKMLWHEDIPIVEELDENGVKTRVKIVAGNYNGNQALSPAPDSWAADDGHQVAVWKIIIGPNGSWQLPKAEPGTNRNLYFFKGDSILINDQSFDYFQAFELDATADVLIKNGNQPTQLLLLQGKPIQEKVVQYGPFVMNTEQEIEDTYRDFQRTQWGGWPWPAHEHVHAREKGRFALHGDGRLEER